MPTICFENENLPYDHVNDCLHAYELNDRLVVPNVGDVVDFGDDSYYEKSEQCGSKFLIVSKEISFSRTKGYVDDCTITLIVDCVL
jgi:hypothetical protein